MRWWWSLPFLFWACAPEPIQVQDGGGPATTSSAQSSSSGSGGSNGLPAPPIAVPASQGTISLPFTFSAVGSGSAAIGEIVVQNGSGTVEIDGLELPVLSYERQPFEDYVLYQSLAMSADRWHIIWFYCLGDALESVFFESTDTALRTESATGVCSQSAAASTASIAFPAVDMPYPQTVDGFSLSGALSLEEGAAGSATLQANTYAWLPFGVIDCSACDSPGWQELHSLFWDGSRACFGIVYLLSEGIQLDYALCLPELDDPFGALLLSGSWEKL